MTRVELLMLMLLPMLDSVKGMQPPGRFQPIRSNDLTYQPQLYWQQQNPGHTQLIQARAPAVKQTTVPNLAPFLGNAINSQAGLRQPLKQTTTTVAPGQIVDREELWTSEERCCYLPDKRLATKAKIKISWFEDDGQPKTAELYRKACSIRTHVYESRESRQSWSSRLRNPGEHDGKYVLEFGQLEGQRDKNGDVSRNAGYEYNKLTVYEEDYQDDTWDFTSQQELQRKLPIMHFTTDGRIRKVVLPSVSSQERAEHQQQTRSTIEGRLAEIHNNKMRKWNECNGDISRCDHTYTFADDKGFRADDGPLMPIHVFSEE